jgi:hypothetical protein
LASAQPKTQVVSHAEVGIERIALEHHGHVALRWSNAADRSITNQDFTGAGAI